MDVDLFRISIMTSYMSPILVFLKQLRSIYDLTQTKGATDKAETDVLPFWQCIFA
jgi:hypothetical protein